MALMATENTEARHYNPKYRKRRKHQGASWTPPSTSAVAGDGLWCGDCRKRHGYMTLGLNYEKYKGKWKLLWYCRRTGRVLEA